MSLTDPESVRLFFAKTERRGDCLIYTGTKINTGYGAFSRWRGPKRERMLAHRYAWTIANGPIPDGMQVCHRCDVRLCVEPTHLFLGTNSDNVRDMIAKGRANPRRAKGVDHWKAILTDEQVREIRAKVAAGESRAQVARDYGVSWSTVHFIHQRRTWRHLD